MSPEGSDIDHVLLSVNWLMFLSGAYIEVKTMLAEKALVIRERMDAR